jgi:CubicO group peptidase (beta-lactamase class C family)
MSIPHAAGALYSTVGDLYTWITALMNGEVVPQAALDTMWDASVPIPDADETHYAYGLISYPMEGRTVIGHDGSINGFVSTLNYFPDENAVIILLSNRQSTNLPPIVETSARFLFGDS